MYPRYLEDLLDVLRTFNLRPISREMLFQNKAKLSLFDNFESCFQFWQDRRQLSMENFELRSYFI